VADAGSDARGLAFRLASGVSRGESDRTGVGGTGDPGHKKVAKWWITQEAVADSSTQLTLSEIKSSLGKLAAKKQSNRANLVELLEVFIAMSMEFPEKMQLATLIPNPSA
jgi:hypothetical protein